MSVEGLQEIDTDQPEHQLVDYISCLMILGLLAGE